MNAIKKILIYALCILVLVSATILGTLAYLTDRATVTNTFTVGNVDITVDETDVDEDGVPEDNAARVTGNEYHLIPGQTYVKDPTMTVEAGSEESYLRMMVTLNGYAALKEVFGEDFLPQNYVEGWDSEIWPCYGVTDNGDNTVTYEFRYFETVDAYGSEDDIVLRALFTDFTLPGTVTGEQLAMLEGFKITVEGHAIQAATFENADAAWAAFEVQYGE